MAVVVYMRQRHLVRGDHIRMFCIVFFQAEEGMRDLVRSGGVGDVYRRQLHGQGRAAGELRRHDRRDPLAHAAGGPRPAAAPVSYTHLTLPTSDLV